MDGVGSNQAFDSQPENQMTAATYSIWTRDSFNVWNKASALYMSRVDAANVATSMVDKLIYQDGSYSNCTGARIFNSKLSRKEILSKVLLLD